MPSSGMLRSVPLVRTDSSKKHIITINRMERVSELGKKLAVAVRCSTLRSVRRHIPDYSIFQVLRTSYRIAAVICCGITVHDTRTTDPFSSPFRIREHAQSVILNIVRHQQNRSGSNIPPHWLLLLFLVQWADVLISRLEMNCRCLETWIKVAKSDLHGQPHPLCITRAQFYIYSLPCGIISVTQFV
jgi:hypothetical protein